MGLLYILIQTEDVGCGMWMTGEEVGGVLCVCFVEIVLVEDEERDGVVVCFWGCRDVKDGAEEAGEGCFAGGGGAGQADYERLRDTLMYCHFKW